MGKYPLDDKGLFFDDSFFESPTAYRRCKKHIKWGVIDSTCLDCKSVALWSEDDEKRQDVVNQNGNTGEHYATKGQGIIKQE